jgi:glucokinase
MTQAVLLCDVTRNNALLTALCAPGDRPESYTSFSVNSVEDLESALTGFLAKADNPHLVAAAISAPGWETAGVQEMPNHGYTLRRDRLRELLHVRRLHMVNSGVARALSVPHLKDSEYEKLFGGEGEPEAVKAVIGIGRGLGMASLIPDDLGRWTAMAGEGGHSDLAPITARESGVVELMAKKYGHVSRERAVSVPGLAEIYRCLGLLDDTGMPEIAPDAVAALSRKGDPQAREAVNMCTGWMAAMASDAALMLGARGGIYLGGVLFEVLGDQFNRQIFQQRFCDKGRLTQYLSDVPAYLMTANHPELIGLTSLFD